MLGQPLVLAVYADASIAKIQDAVLRQMMVTVQVVQGMKEVMRIDGGTQLLRESAIRLATESQEEGTSGRSTAQYFAGS